MDLPFIRNLCRPKIERSFAERPLRNSRALMSLFNGRNRRSKPLEKSRFLEIRGPQFSPESSDKAFQSLRKIFPEAEFKPLERLLAVCIAFNFVVTHLRIGTNPTTPTIVATEQSSEKNQDCQLAYEQLLVYFTPSRLKRVKD